MHPKSWTDFWRCIFLCQEKKKFNTKYSPEFKIAVIMDMRENHMRYSETARKYGLGTKSDGARKSFTTSSMGTHILGRRSGRVHDRTSRKEKHGQTEETAIG